MIQASSYISPAALHIFFRYSSFRRAFCHLRLSLRWGNGCVSSCFALLTCLLTRHAISSFPFSLSRNFVVCQFGQFLGEKGIFLHLLLYLLLFSRRSFAAGSPGAVCSDPFGILRQVLLYPPGVYWWVKKKKFWMGYLRAWIYENPPPLNFWKLRGGGRSLLTRES